jgi:hypothetical protein
LSPCLSEDGTSLAVLLIAIIKRKIMIDEKNLKEEDKKSEKNAGAANEEQSAPQPLGMDQQNAEEEADLEQQRKEALTERD